MDKIVDELRFWWSTNSYDVLSDVGPMSAAEVRDYVADGCFGSGEVPSFHDLSEADQEKALKLAFPNKRYGV